MKFRAVKAFGNYEAGRTYDTNSPAEEGEVRRAISAGEAQEITPQQQQQSQQQPQQQPKQMGGGTSTDGGQTVTNPGGQRGSVGAQQLQPEKGQQVREGVSGQPIGGQQASGQTGQQQQGQGGTSGGQTGQPSGTKP